RGDLHLIQQRQVNGLAHCAPPVVGGLLGAAPVAGIGVTHTSPRSIGIPAFGAGATAGAIHSHTTSNGLHARSRSRDPHVVRLVSAAANPATPTSPMSAAIFTTPRRAAARRRA